MIDEKELREAIKVLTLLVKEYYDRQIPKQTTSSDPLEEYKEQKNAINVLIALTQSYLSASKEFPKEEECSCGDPIKCVCGAMEINEMHNKCFLAHLKIMNEGVMSASEIRVIMENAWLKSKGINRWARFKDIAQFLHDEMKKRVR